MDEVSSTNATMSVSEPEIGVGVKPKAPRQAVND